MPLVVKISPNHRAVISLSIDKTCSMKGVLRNLTTFFQSNMEMQEEKYSNSKLILSENNHQLFMCKDAEILESIYKEPTQLINMLNAGTLNF
jgi:hypothetical protein